MKFQYDDGGRAAAGFKGKAGDCCARSIAIAAQMPYADAYALVNEVSQSDRRGKRKRGSGISSARTGVYKATMQRVMARLGWKWTPTMHIGSGCKVHLRADELPAGRIICNVSKHYCAVIDGVIHDTFDPSERGTTIYPPHTKPEDLPKGAYRLTYPDGTPHPNGWAYKPERCVYGYWSPPSPSTPEPGPARGRQMGNTNAKAALQAIGMNMDGMTEADAAGFIVGLGVWTAKGCSVAQAIEKHAAQMRRLINNATPLARTLANSPVFVGGLYDALRVKSGSVPEPTSDACEAVKAPKSDAAHFAGGR